MSALPPNTFSFSFLYEISLNTSTGAYTITADTGHSGLLGDDAGDTDLSDGSAGDAVETSYETAVLQDVTNPLLQSVYYTGYLINGAPVLMYYDASWNSHYLLATTDEFTVGATGNGVYDTYYYPDYTPPPGVVIYYGDTGDNTASGGIENDTMAGGAGNDTIDGGDGADRLWGDGKNSYAELPSGADSLLGGNGNDSIYAGPGSDTIDGGADNDWIGGEGGSDYMIGGAGNDVFYGDASGAGGEGDDTIDGGDGNDAMYSHGGNDVLKGGNGADTMYGMSGNDTYYIDAMDTIVESASGGTDTVITENIASYTLGTDFENLTLVAGEGVLHTGEGNASDNRLIGTSSGIGATFSLSGLDGNDFLQGDEAKDTLNGGNGNDTLRGQLGFDSLSGGTGEDSLDGGWGNDTLWAGAGNDLLSGGYGNDLLGGGDGNDTAAGGAGRDLLYGGSGDDSLAGDVGNDTLRGDAGLDTLVGGDGDDLLDGLMGSDALSGGAGADMFRFSSAFSSGADAITDFVSGTDTLQVLRALTNLPSFGVLDSSRLALGSGASDGDDRFVFDGTSGSLYYDADGNGGGAQVLMATLGGVTSITASDIVIYDTVS